MKNAIIILSILFIPLCFSCANSNEKRFIGSWKNKQHDSIEINIKKDGDKFMVATLLYGEKSSSFSYLLKDSILMREVVLFQWDKETISVTPSGHLFWQGIEYEKLN